MVRLRQLLTWYRKLCKLVSIPLWCDCDLASLSKGQGLGPVSIPLWCDCDEAATPALSANPSSFNPTMVRLRLSLDFAKNLPEAMVSIPLWCDCDQGDIKLLKCLASAKGLVLFQLYFSTYFPFCQIGKVGKLANFAANLRLPPKPREVDGKRNKSRFGVILRKFRL